MQKGNSFKALSILHKAMLAGQVLFTAVCFYLLYTKIFIASSQELDKILQVAAILFSVAGFFAGNFLFKKRVLQARESTSELQEKFAVYRSASILQWALLEAPVLFSVICFLLTGNYAFLALAAAVILLFVILGPTKIKIALLLGTTEDEIAEL
jgi:hypothetical protein